LRREKKSAMNLWRLWESEAFTQSYNSQMFLWKNSMEMSLKLLSPFLKLRFLSCKKLVITLILNILHRISRSFIEWTIFIPLIKHLNKHSWVMCMEGRVFVCVAYIVGNMVEIGLGYIIKDHTWYLTMSSKPPILPLIFSFKKDHFGYWIGV
jgi:ABC-type proline/glycine betaine transport system permease subunit